MPMSPKRTSPSTTVREGGVRGSEEVRENVGENSNIHTFPHLFCFMCACVCVCVCVCDEFMLCLYDVSGPASSPLSVYLFSEQPFSYDHLCNNYTEQMSALY